MYTKHHEPPGDRLHFATFMFLLVRVLVQECLTVTPSCCQGETKKKQLWLFFLFFLVKSQLLNSSGLISIL